MQDFFIKCLILLAFASNDLPIFGLHCLKETPVFVSDTADYIIEKFFDTNILLKAKNVEINIVSVHSAGN